VIRYLSPNFFGRIWNTRRSQGRQSLIQVRT
jgi:hypothetical protein